jgi:hypothetical protein
MEVSAQEKTHKRGDERDEDLGVIALNKAARPPLKRFRPQAEQNHTPSPPAHAGVHKANAEKFRATRKELAATPRPKNVHPKLWEAFLRQITHLIINDLASRWPATVASLPRGLWLEWSKRREEGDHQYK